MEKTDFERLGTLKAYKCTNCNEHYIINSITEHAFCPYCSAVEGKEPVTVDFIIENGNLIKYMGTARHIIIPEQVTHISDYAMAYHREIQSASLPNALITIGKSAFCGCTELNKIVIPSTVTNIGDNAFSGCTHLEFAELNGTQCKVGNNAFAFCSKLTSVDLSKGVADLGRNAFYGCNSLSLVTLSTALTVIRECTFFDCKSLRYIELTKGITAIEAGAFSGCSALQFINLPKALKTIGRFAFCGCSELLDVDFSNAEGLKLHTGAFAQCTKLHSLNLHYNIASLPRFCFNECTGLTFANLSGVRDICENAFSACTALSYVNVGEKLTRLEEFAFSGCTALAGEILLPETLREMSAGAFAGCKNTLRVIVPEHLSGIDELINEIAGCEIATTLSNDIIDDSGEDLPETNSEATAEPSEAMESQEQTETVEAEQKEVVVGRSETTGRQFARLEPMDFDFDIPTARDILDEDVPNEESSEEHTEAVTEDTNQPCTPTPITDSTDVPQPTPVPKQTTQKPEIQDGWLHRVNAEADTMEDIVSILDSDDLRNIGIQAVIEDTQNAEYSEADTANSAYTDMEFVSDHRSVEDSGQYLDFPGEFEVVDGIIINYHGFDDNVVIPDRIKGIGEKAFSGKMIKCVTFPDSVTEIADNAFTYCIMLSEIQFGEGLIKIDREAFYGCCALETLIFPSSLRSIGVQAFSLCSSLISVDFPEELDVIGSNAFTGCTKLIRAKVGESTNCAQNAFSDCPELIK